MWHNLVEIKKQIYFFMSYFHGTYNLCFPYDTNNYRRRYMAHNLLIRLKPNVCPVEPGLGPIANRSVLG
jgi:hypothetical protein